MKVLYAHKHHPIEPLGVAYISSSIARSGHESKLMLTPRNIDKAVEEVSRVIDQEHPDIFAQSIIFGSHKYAIDLSRKVKERYPKIISFLGGPAPTFTPGLISRGFDAICRYEGENPFLTFCNNVESGADVGNIPNIWVMENPDLYNTEVRKVKKVLDKNDLNYKKESGYDPQRKMFVNDTGVLLEDETLENIPFPDRELLYEHEMYRDSDIKHYMSTRGCAFKCSYCHVHVQNADNKGKGSPVRRRQNESVAEEVLAIKKKFGSKNDYFQDDIHGASYKLEFAKEYAEVMAGVSQNGHCHVRFDLIAKHPDIAKYLAKAGITGVHVAIESGDDYIRNHVHRRGMTIEEILKGAKYLHDNGIKMMTQNILGAAGETKEQMLKTLELNIAVRPTFASASIFQPYPGTSALEYARDHGVLPSNSEDELIDLFGMETFYNKTILIQDPQHKRWLELFQKFFAIAVANPQIYQSGVLDKIIATYPKGEEANKELEHMYRLHRAEADEKLYGVKLKEIVMEEN
ncbi:B12-binding domain-containing radical SAM protein [Candidatus Pacearchaeota archaeon]|nr:B12-binding domain-containing radical SAM protein [Candidatus Pacearchaeota archaeon]